MHPPWDKFVENDQVVPNQNDEIDYGDEGDELTFYSEEDDGGLLIPLDPQPNFDEDDEYSDDSDYSDDYNEGEEILILNEPVIEI